MVTIASLWLAILVSTVFVFFASFILHTLLPHHKSDYRVLPDEGAVSGLSGLAPGQYDFPHSGGMSDLKDEVMIAKYNAGPVGLVTMLPSGVPNMNKSLMLSVLHNLVVAVLVAYICAAMLNADAEYLTVFRLAGLTAWLAYGWGAIPDAIWFGKPWSVVLKYMGDGLVYALLTAGTFGWLWG